MILDDLTGGLASFPEPHSINDDQATVCKNVDFQKQTTIRSRTGFKRGNRTSAGAAIRGFFQGVKADGTLMNIVKVGATYSTFSTTGFDITIGPALALPPGFVPDSTNVPVFVQMRDAVYIFDGNPILGGGGNAVFDGTVLAEINKPASPNITDATIVPQGNGTGDLSAGQYRYAFAFFSTLLQSESALTIAAPTLTGADDSVLITLGPNTLNEMNTVWDSVRVYRTVVGPGSEFFLDETITPTQPPTPPTSGSVTSSKSDAALGTAARNLDPIIQLPPAYWAIEYLGRMIAVTVAEPTLLYISNPGAPSEFTADQALFVKVQNGNPIVSGMILNGRLIVATRSELFTLSGDTFSNFEFVEIEGGRGAVSIHGMESFSGIGYVFQAEDYIYRFRGAEVEPIGWRIRDVVEDLVKAAFAQAYIGEEERGHAIWWVTPDGTFVYNEAANAWSFYDIEGTCTGYILDGDSRPRLVFGNFQGYLNWAQGFECDGDPGGTVFGVADTGNPTTIVDNAASFDQTGDGLENLQVVCIFADGTIEQRNIFSNTATQISVIGQAFTQPVVAGTLYYVGAIDFEWISKLTDTGQPFFVKKIDVARVALRPQGANAEPLYTRVVPDEATTVPYEQRDITTARVVEFGVPAGGYRFQFHLRHVCSNALTAPFVAQHLQMATEDVGQTKGRTRQ